MVKSPSSRSKQIIRHVSRIILRVIFIFLLLIVIVLFLLQTSFVQNFGRKKIQAYLASKLHTQVIIGELSVDFPKTIVLKNLYLEDQHRDTLLSAGNLNLDVNLWGLFKHQVVVNNMTLDRWTVNVKRQLPDSVFNYAFIVKAFASGNAHPEKATKGNSPWVFELGTIHLVNIRAHYQDDATGNETTLFLSDLQTTIKTFDPNQLIFAAPDFSVKGLNGNVRLYKPTLILRQEKNRQPTPPAWQASTVNRQPTIKRQPSTHAVGVAGANPQSIHLQLGKIGLDSILLAYSDEPGNTKANVNVGGLSILTDSIDLNTMQFDLKSVDLNQSSFQLVHGKSGLQQTAGKSGVQRNDRKEKSEKPESPKAWTVHL